MWSRWLEKICLAQLQCMTKYLLIFNKIVAKLQEEFGTQNYQYLYTDEQTNRKNPVFPQKHDCIAQALLPVQE